LGLAATSFLGWMPFLTPNQQYQSDEKNQEKISDWNFNPCWSTSRNLRAVLPSSWLQYSSYWLDFSIQSH